MYAALAICALPNTALTQRGREIRAIQPPAPFIALMIAMRLPISSRPRVKPAIGELIIGNTTFHSRPLFLLQSPTVSDQISASKLLSEAASAAPHRPPTSAWLDEDGSPNHQVIRFQTMPPSSAQMISCEVTTTTV